MKYDKAYFEGKGSNYTRYQDKALIIERKYMPKVLKIANLSTGSNILDIGCAFGFFLRLCDALGCNTFGIEVSEYAVEQAKKETKAKLYLDDVEKCLPAFQDDYFDLVTMFDVIEHLRGPYFVLNEIRRILKPKGRLIVTTPNLNALERFSKKVLGKEKTWHGFYDEAHIHVFTPISLRFMVERAKLQTVKLETTFHPLPEVIQKLANKTGLGGQIWLVSEKPQALS